MNAGGEAADQVIRMSLNGMEVAAKISGKAAVEVAQMLYAIMKDLKETKGKTSLVNLMKTGKPLSVFSVRASDFSSFQKKPRSMGSFTMQSRIKMISVMVWSILWSKQKMHLVLIVLLSVFNYLMSVKLHRLKLI